MLFTQHFPHLALFYHSYTKKSASEADFFDRLPLPAESGQCAVHAAAVQRNDRDSGSSLGYDKLASAILAGRGVKCKPFKRTHEEQLKLVTSFDWVDFGSLYGLGDEMRAIFDKAGEYMEPARKDAVCSSVSHRIEHLMELTHGQRNQMDDQTQDVAKDAAADYNIKMGM